MKYFLAQDAVLKMLEIPSVYQMKTDELYELDDGSFEFLKKCASAEGCASEDKEFIGYCLNEGILSKEEVSLKRPPLLQSPGPSLRYLELQITNKCNLRCGHCYIGKDGSKELPVEMIINILRQFETIQGLRVLITGGEPLLHSRFAGINEALQDFSIRKVLFTNGVLLSRKILEGLNVDEIQISIDGLEKAHDSLRGKGAFEAALNAVRSSIDAGIEVSVSTMVHPKNLDDFDEMERLFKSLGVKDWTVDVPCTTGRLEKNAEFRISPEQGGKYLRYGYDGGLHGGGPGFACGLHLMSVTADGSVSKCTFYSDRAVGKVEEGLMECWKRIEPIRLADLECDCEYIESCRGGCRFRAELLGGPLGKDFYRCALYDIIK